MEGSSCKRKIGSGMERERKDHRHEHVKSIREGKGNPGV